MNTRAILYLIGTSLLAFGIAVGGTRIADRIHEHTSAIELMAASQSGIVLSIPETSSRKR